MNLEAEIVARLIEDTQFHSDRWAKLVDVIGHVSRPEQERLLDAISALDVADWSEDEREAVLDRIRVVLAHHRGFPDAWWALPESVLDRLDALSPQFAPKDLLRSVSWLFSQRAQLPEDADVPSEDPESRITHARADAVRKVLTASGVSGVLDLARRAEARWLVGVALADAGLAEEPVQFAEALRRANGDLARDVARAMVLRGADLHDVEWVQAAWRGAESAQLPGDWRVLFLLAAPLDHTTWAILRSCDRDLQNLYWRQLVVYGRGSLDPARVRTVADGLHDFGEIARAIDFLALYRAQADPEQILRVLEAAASPERIKAIPWQQLHFDLTALLEKLQQSDVDLTRLATIEWQLAPFHEPGGFKPRALLRHLTADPRFFVEILSYVFRRRHEEPRTDLPDDERARAMRGYDLLRSWHSIPGARSDGTIVLDDLRTWVQQARELARSVDRIEIADLQIGQMLASSPDGADGAWPHEAVRTVMEDIATDQLADGFLTGVYNSRGVFLRAAHQGGVQERKLAARYRDSADRLTRWPWVADVLRRIADQYDSEARFVDTQAQLEDR